MLLPWAPAHGLRCSGRQRRVGGGRAPQAKAAHYRDTGAFDDYGYEKHQPPGLGGKASEDFRMLSPRAQSGAPGRDSTRERPERGTDLRMLGEGSQRRPGRHGLSSDAHNCSARVLFRGRKVKELAVVKGGGLAWRESPGGSYGTGYWCKLDPRPEPSAEYFRTVPGVVSARPFPYAWFSGSGRCSKFIW